MRNASSSLTVKTPYRMESQVSHQCFITVDDFFLECSWDEMSCWSKELHLVTHCRKTSCTDHVLHQTWPWSITSLVLYSCLLLGFSPSKCIHHPFTFPPNYLAIKLKCHDTSIHSIPVWPLPLSQTLCCHIKVKCKLEKHPPIDGMKNRRWEFESVPSSPVPWSSLMAKDERVIFRVSCGTLVLHTRMAASGTQDCTSYLSSVIVCKEGPHG